MPRTRAIIDTTQLVPTSTLPLIPSELWTITFLILRNTEKQRGSVRNFVEFVPDGETIFALRNVSLTCKAFYLVALPLRYERLVLCLCHHGRYGNLTQTRVQHLVAHPEMRAWVKTLGIQGQTPYEALEGDGPICTLTQSLEEVFAGMVNLVELMFDTLKVTRNPYTHLFRLKRLRRLELCEVEFSKDIVTSEYDVTSLSIRSLKVHGVGAYPADYNYRPFASLCFAPTLQEIDFPSIAPAHFIELNSRHQLTSSPNLRTFKLSTPSTSQQFNVFFDFLRGAPELRYLELRGALEVPVNSLPVGLIPKLEVYEGPIEMAKILIPGRPVAVIRVRGVNSHIVPEIPTHLSLGTVPVREFSHSGLSWRDDQFLLLAGLFPGLERLRLQLDYRRRGDPEVWKRWVVSQLTEDVERFAHLRNMSVAPYMNSVPGGVDLDLAALQAIRTDHPLETITLPSGHCWTKENGAWVVSND